MDRVDLKKSYNIRDDPDYELYDFSLPLPTNSPLPPNEKVFRDLINLMVRDVIRRGKLPSQINIYCKRAGPTGAPPERQWATLILKAFVRKDGYL